MRGASSSLDHTNVGAIFLAATALGVDAVLVTPHRAVPLYRRSIRVRMGTVLQVPWTHIASWPGSVAMLRDQGWVVAAMALSDDSVTLDELAARAPEHLTLVMGTEGDGLGSRTVAERDLTVRIPMSGDVDSLNVASARAVAMYTLRLTAGSGWFSGRRAL